MQAGPMTEVEIMRLFASFGLGDDDREAWRASGLQEAAFESWLRECGRVLEPRGRLALYTTAPELRGTPAAPEPLASRGHLYSDQQLLELAHGAGLSGAVVRNDNGGQLLTALT